MNESDSPDDSDHISYVFITGARCAPSKWTDPETGKIQWCWVVCSIEDDSFSYINGKNVNVQETADTKAGLIIPWD